MKALALFLVLSVSLPAAAQHTINVDDTSKFTNSILYFNSGSGIPFVLTKYAKIVEGSVFIPQYLSPAQIYLKGNEKPLNNILSRMNIIDNQLNYFDEIKKIELSAVDPISEIRFKDSTTNQVRIFMQSIPGCEGLKPGWYEVMETGKLSLYRQVIKTISETKIYGSATTEQRVETSYNYWIKVGSGCRPVKKISELTDLILQSDPGFKSKLPQRKLSDRKEEDWVEVTKTYNASH